MLEVRKSDKLQNVGYEIRGRVLMESRRLEEEGHRILKLNIGNPAPFGFDVPEEILQDVIYNMDQAQGYVDSKGLFSARKAVQHYTQQCHVPNVDIEDIYLGNGVSELIVMSMQALLNTNDEVLIPAPDYPLWTAAVTLSSGKAVHYQCDERSDWYPDLQDIENKITPKTRAIVVINPNNPTGAVYSEDLLQQLASLACRHKLIILADEIYDKILYDGATHTSLASMVEETLCLTFNGLSKNYRAAGYRAGWLVVSGAKLRAEDFIEGLNMLSSMRLCANVPAQLGIQTALGGYQSINDLVAPGGRLCEQRNLAYDLITQIPGVSCVKPKGALYLFPCIDSDYLKVKDDEQLVLDLLKSEHILLVQGSAFNLHDKQHFRLVFLPREDELSAAIKRVSNFLEHYDQG
jgi:alanine-synthesizing transaminase